MKLNKKQLPGLMAIFLFVILLEVFLVVSNWYIIALLIPVIICFLIIIIGRLTTRRLFKTKIIGLLDSNEGQLEKYQIINHFLSRAPGTSSDQLRDMIEASLAYLQKEGLVDIQGNTVIKVT